jgi:hypothetical protein
LKSLLRHFVLLLGCLHLVGGSYSLVQVYAWANMIFTYSKETGVSKAMTDTFSGEKPCSLCKKIAAAKVKESGDQPKPLVPASPLAKTAEPLFPPSVVTLRAPRHTLYLAPDFVPLAPAISMQRGSPPTPPPRC